jgi:hypothetical protein
MTHTSNDRLVYYTLSAGRWSEAAVLQLVRSVRSLRAHNRAIAVRLFLCGEIAGSARAELESMDVGVEDVGAYEEHLGRLCPPRMSEVLARYPILHKSTCLPRLLATGAERVLYVDSDTFFIRDVEALFDRYTDLDLYAREEPYSRRSPAGYRPEAIDEDALAALALREGARPIAPFNTGVMLFNHGSWRKLAERVEELLRDVFRFSVWIADRTDTNFRPDITYLREHRARLVRASDEAEALPYPSRNAWIKDQVSIWLTLGKIPDFRPGLLGPQDLLMGAEFADADPGTHVLCHYFSANERRFDAWLVDHGLPSGGGGEVAGGPLPRVGLAAPTLRVFEDLGATIEEAWERLDYDELAFPALAAGALREARIHEAISGADVIRWLLAAREIPEQDDIEASFGEPPITVLHGRRFYIQVLLWTEGTTSIHRHAFSGAFVVLDGSSLHVRYAFAPRRRVSSHLQLGAVRLESLELLARGDVTAITHDLIHSTFHLETPSATVVIRTYRDADASIQHEYMPPSVAFDPFFKDPGTTRRLQALTFMRRMMQPGHVELAADLVARSDLHTAWLVLLQAYRSLRSAARAAPLLDAARRRHGAAADDLAAALDEELRRRKLHRLRALVTDEAHRFFLALLQNLPDREAIYAAVRLRYRDGEPRARVIAWMEALSGAGTIGVDLTDKLTRTIVLALLDGRSMAGVLERLKESFDPGDVDAGASAIARHCERIRRTTLSPLFIEGSGQARVDQLGGPA